MYSCVLHVLLCSVCTPVLCMYSCVLHVLLCSAYTPVFCMYSCVLYVLLYCACTPVFCMYSCVLHVLLCSVCTPVLCMYSCIVHILLCLVCTSVFCMHPLLPIYGADRKLPHNERMMKLYQMSTCGGCDPCMAEVVQHCESRFCLERTFCMYIHTYVRMYSGNCGLRPPWGLPFTVPYSQVVSIARCFVWLRLFPDQPTVVSVDRWSLRQVSLYILLRVEGFVGTRVKVHFWQKIR